MLRMLLNTWVQAQYFVLILIPVIVIKLISISTGKYGAVVDQVVFPSRDSYILFGVSLVLCILTTLPLAGQGYDTPIFVFRADYIRENGVSAIFRTDRPLTYLITHYIGEILDVPGRLSIPISAVIFSFFYGISVFILTLVLTKNLFMSSVATLFVANSHIVRATALCFVGNVLGLVFFYLFFASTIRFYESKKMHYNVLSILLFTAMLLSHYPTSIISLIILVVFSFCLLLNKERIRFRRMIVVTLICASLFSIFFVCYHEIFAIFQSMAVSTMSDVGKRIFMDYLGWDWCADYLSVFFFSMVGSWYVLFRRKTSEKFLTAWIVGIVSILPLSSAQAGRFFIYLPFPIVAAVGANYVVHYCKEHFKINLLGIGLLFLLIIPAVYSVALSHMNIKYLEEGPFPWDFRYTEIEQLKWIKNNYNLKEVVVLTDVDSSLSLQLRSRGLNPGVSTRILAEIGSNVYFGRLAELFEEKPDLRALYNSSRLGYYSSLNVDWTLENKTILIPSTIYIISAIEKEIMSEIPGTGIYVVKELSSQQKQHWLERIRTEDLT